MGLAHHARGKGGERRRGQSGCLCFIWNCPPQATRGQPQLEAVWPADARAHTHTIRTQHSAHTGSRSSSGSTIFCSWSRLVSVVFVLSASYRCDRGPEQTTVSCVPELAGVFILGAVTCCSFRRDCLFSHTAHSALFINAQTQEVLFIRQSDRDQWGVREHACIKGQLCQTSGDVWGVC